MGFLSQQGQLIFRSQTTPGTYNSDTGTSGVAVRHRSGTLSPNRDLLIPDPEIGGSRDISDAYLGAVSYSGTYDFYVRMQSIAFFLYAALGGKATVAGSSSLPTAHTLTPAATVPWLSIEHAIANSYDTYNYSDAKANTLHFECDANGYLMGTIGLVAKTMADNATRTSSPTTDIAPMVVGTNITISYNGVTLPAKSFSFDLNNNLEEDDFRLGSLTLGDVTEKRREITMGCTIRPADASLWRNATLGSGATTSPTGLTLKQAVVITISSYENVPGVTAPTAVYSTTLTVPKAAIKPFAVSPSGDDVLQHDIEIQALQPNPATPIITAVSKSDLTTIF